MDFRQQLERIAKQVGGLSASQRMLTVCLVAIMVITVVWWGRYAAAPEMVPVLDRSLGPEHVQSIKNALAAAGIKPRVVNDRILVPAERHMEALAALSYAKALPSDSEDAWDQIVKQSSPWETAEKTSAMFNRAREKMLERLILTFPGVDEAHLKINPTVARRIGARGDLEPTASVVVKARDGANVKNLVDAAASTVANAVSGLKVANVSVVVNGKTFRPSDPGSADAMASDQYGIIKEREQYYADKILAGMTVPNAIVTVAVDLDTKRSRETRETYDPKNLIYKETSTETQTSETHGAVPRAGGEPGAQANTGLSVEAQGAAAAAGAADGGSTVTERTRTQMELLASKSTEQIEHAGWGARVTRASVRLPISFFVQQYRQTNPSAGEPAPGALAPIIKDELEQVKKTVLSCCTGLAEADVSVGTYVDQLPVTAAASAETAAQPAGVVGNIATKYAKEIAIGGLAVMSLFMVSMMVRRAPVAAAIAPPVELREAAPLATDEDIAGEVGQGGALLDAMGLDDDTIKAQQMVEQVSTMVEENPDAAASLVKRWLNRSRKC